MGKFNQAAKAAAKEIGGGSALAEGRTKIKTDLLIASYPNGFTIDQADLITKTDKDTGDEKVYCLFTIKEDPSKFVTGGMALTAIVQKWVEMFANIDDMNSALKAEGGCKVKLEKKFNQQTGRTFTDVTVLED